MRHGTPPPEPQTWQLGFVVVTVIAFLLWMALSH